MEEVKKREVKLSESSILGGKYVFLEKMGQGSFGMVWSALDNRNNYEVAVKIEHSRSESKQLYLEASIYLLLWRNSSINGQGIPRILDYGEDQNYNFMVMQRLGDNLRRLLSHRKRIGEDGFSLETVYSIGVQLLKRIRYLHSRRIVHRDLKPSNIAIGGEPGNKHRLFLLDFGLAKKYIDASGTHIEDQRNKGLIGTPQFASIRAHEKCELSRKDDIESIGYILLYLYFGKLPWSKVKGKDKNQVWNDIMKKKNGIDFAQECKDSPEMMPVYNMIEMARNLHFEQPPNYQLCLNNFEKELRARCEDRSYVLDWIKDEVKNMDLSDS